MTRVLLELDEGVILEVIGIYRSEEDTERGVQGCTSFEVVAGPKAYARIWDSMPEKVEWGWVLAERATSLWRSDPSEQTRQGHAGDERGDDGVHAGDHPQHDHHDQDQ